MNKLFSAVLIVDPIHVHINTAKEMSIRDIEIASVYTVSPQQNFQLFLEICQIHVQFDILNSRVTKSQCKESVCTPVNDI